MEKRELGEMLDQGWSLERIGNHVGKNPATVSYWLKKYGLEPVNKEKVAAKGGIDRASLETLVAEGKTIAEIACDLKRSKATIRHWLAQYGLRTRNGVGRRPRHEFEPPERQVCLRRPGSASSMGRACLFVRQAGRFVANAAGSSRSRFGAERSRRSWWRKRADDAASAATTVIPPQWSSTTSIPARSSMR
jgi:transposase-like protein